MPRIGRDHRLGARVGRRVAAAHHREHAVLGAGLAAGHRRIDEIEAALLRLGVKLARDLGRGGGVIDEHRALCHAGEGAVRRRASPRAGRCRCRRSTSRSPGRAAASFGVAARLPPYCATHLLGLGGGAVVDRDLVAALVLEMPGHRDSPSRRARETPPSPSFPPANRPVRSTICTVIATAAVARQLGVDPVCAARMVARTKATAERHGADQGTGARQPRQGAGAGRHAAAADRHAVRHRGQRRQGVLLDHRRCRRGEGLGAGAQARRGGGARDARRAVGDGRADRRAQGGGAAAPARRRRPRTAAHAPRARPWRRQARSRRARRRRRSSRSPPARAASANRPPRSISRSACAISA